MRTTLFAKDVAEWEDIISPPGIPVRCISTRPDFHGSLDAVMFSPKMVVSRLRCDPAIVQSAAKNASAHVGDELIVAFHMRRGASMLQSGRGVSVNAGEATIYDPAMPFRLDYSNSPQDQIATKIESKRLGVSPDRMSALIARVLTAKTPGCAALFGILRGAVQDTADIPPGMEDLVEELMAVAIRSLIGVSPRWDADRSLRESVRSYAMSRLGDPELSVHALAHAHHVSDRKLYALFADVADSPAAWLRSQRIAVARRLLATTDLSIAAVALKTGIPDASSFSRAFRREVGVSPREFRTDMLESARDRSALVEAG